MLLCGFESCLGLESSDCSYVAFFEARRQGFSPGTPVSSSPSSVQWFSQKNKAKINDFNSVLIAELSLRATWHATRHVISARCVHVICTRLRPRKLSIRVEDSSRRSEETVKTLDLRL